MWKVVTLDKTVNAEIEALPNDQKAKFFWISQLI